MTVPVTAEGSSRVTCVHDLLDLRSAEVPYDRDERRFRAHIRKLNEDIAAAGTDHDPRTHEAVRVAITSQSTRKKTSPKLLFDLATSLVLRSVPEEDTRRRERIRRYLKEGFSNELAKEEWEATFRSAEELAAAALSEAESGIPGPATRELAARSAYPLVVSGQLLDRSRDLDQPDRRKPGEVINRMRATPDGVYQLRQVLVDAAGGRRIRMVDTTGQVERNAEGRDIIAKDIDLRRRVHAPGEGSERTPLPGTPAELLGNTLNTLGNAVRAVETAVKEIEAVESDDGTPAIDSLGADKQDCDAWQVILFAALQKLAIWSNRSIQRHAPLTTTTSTTTTKVPATPKSSDVRHPARGARLRRARSAFARPGPASGVLRRTRAHQGHGVAGAPPPGRGAAGTTASPADTDTPVTMAKVTGAELLRLLRAEADRVADIADRLRDAVETVADPTAAEAEVEAVRAAAEQRAAAAEARAAAAEARAAAAEARAAAAKQRAAEADQWRAEADAATEDVAVQLAAAQARAERAETACGAAEADRDAAVEAARADAAARIAAAETERDAAVGQARGEAGRRVSAAQADLDLALARTEEAEQAARLAQQEAARAQAAAEAAAAETGRVRADADMTLASFRADAARDRDELRADLRARAERAGRQADAYRDELTQLRAGTSHHVGTTTARSPARTMPASQS